MTEPRGTLWDGVLAAVVLFAIVAFLCLVLVRWAWKRDQRRTLGKDWQPPSRSGSEDWRE